MYEWKLPKRWMEVLQHQWGPLKIDAFESRENKMLPIYWSKKMDPGAQDAFIQRWPKTDLYLHPP
jgi:hypothetical protein